MTLTTWLALLTAIVIISMTPGAGAINTMSNALSQGWARAGWGVLGQQVALAVQILVVAAGLGVLVTTVPVVLEVVRYAGAAYLAYLGVRLLIARTDANTETEFAEIREGAWPMVRRGFWVNMLNPKAIVFLLAFIPQFIRSDEPLVQQYTIIFVTLIAVDVVVMWAGFAALAQPFRSFTRTSRGRRVLNVVFGALFLGVAALLLVMR